MSVNGQRKSRHHGHRRRDTARKRRGDDVAAPARGRVGRWADHAIRLDRLRRPLRLRGEGLRPFELDRAQAGPAYGSLRAAHPRGGPQAEADSGVDIASEGDRVGASIATGIGGLKSFQDCYDTLRERGPDRVNPFAIPCIIPNMGAGWVSMELGRGARSRRSAQPARRRTWRSARAGRHPARPCRSDVLRRHRVCDQPGRHRRLRRHACPLAAERRPARASRPFDAGARRVRHG